MIYNNIMVFKRLTKHVIFLLTRLTIPLWHREQVIVIPIWKLVAMQKLKALKLEIPFIYGRDNVNPTQQLISYSHIPTLQLYLSFCQLSDKGNHSHVMGILRRFC